MFVVALSTIAKLWKQSKCPSTVEWIKKMWGECVCVCVCVCVCAHTHTYTYNGLLDIKKNEILPFTMRWLEPECIRLSEISQSEKNKYHMISLICGI